MLGCSVNLKLVGKFLKQCIVLLITIGIMMNHQKFLRTPALRYLILALIVLFSVISNRFEQPDALLEPFASNALLVFLGKSEDKLEAFSSALFEALEQKAGPILASGNLLRPLFSMRSLDELINDKNISLDQRKKYTSLKEYHQMLSDWLECRLGGVPTGAMSRKWMTAEMMDFADDLAFPRYGNEKEFLDFFYDFELTQPGLVKMFSTFNPDDWIAKKVDADLVLLIPKAYVERMRKKFGSRLPLQKEFAEEELLLGMRMNSMRPIRSLNEYSRLHKGSDAESVDLVGALDKIFITDAEYKKLGSAFVPSWAFYMGGHGLLAKFIVDIPLEQFKAVLDFFETKLTTKLLVYSTCYGAGVNSEIVYAGAKEGVQKVYSFAIATEALTDASVTSAVLRVNIIPFSESDIDFERKRMKIATHHRFDAFIQDVTSLHAINYTHIVSHVFPVAKELDPRKQRGEGAPAQDVCNLPQLRRPGSAQFEVLDSDCKVIVIDDTLVLSGEKEIDLVRHVGRRQPLGILLYAPYVPCTFKNSLKLYASNCAHDR